MKYWLLHLEREMNKPKKAISEIPDNKSYANSVGSSSVFHCCTFLVMKLGNYYQDALRSRMVQFMVYFDEIDTTQPWMLS